MYEQRQKTESRPSLSWGGAFNGLLTLMFIYLKLTNQVQWSWLWVLSPLWISFALGMVILLVVFAVFYIKEVR